MSIPQVSSVKLELPAPSGARDGPRPAAAVKGPQAGAGVAPPTTDAVQAQQAGPEQVAEAVQQMNRAMKMANSALEFSVDQDTDRVVVTMTDRDTGEVVRQYPSEEALALSRYLDSVSQGALLSQKA
jgi:flagellar protein FlaG